MNRKCSICGEHQAELCPSCGGMTSIQKAGPMLLDELKKLLAASESMLDFCQDEGQDATSDHEAIKTAQAAIRVAEEG